MYEKIVLPNGVRILHEHNPYVRSAALGIWVGTGSRYEPARMGGASHFIEHMLFKGTATRSAAELAGIMDAIGGQSNAFTTKECTCFHGRVLDIHLDQLTDVLCDMFFHSQFDESDVANERGVILEEIDMYRDTPEDLASERLFAAAFKGSSLSRPILGSKSSLSRMTGQELCAYKDAHYSPQSIVIAVSGSYSAADIDRLKSLFAGMTKKTRHKLKGAEYTPAFSVKRKSLEQNHLILSFPGVSVTDKSRYSLQLLSDILGGGMSSRLFQTVREKLGLCYSVFTYGTSYIDTGLFSIYTALNKEMESKALTVILEELRKLLDGGVTEQELSRAREQIKANVLMSLESTHARMNRLGRSELYFGYVPDPDEIIANYDSVTPDSVRAIAERCLDLSQASFSAVGKVDDADAYRALIGA